MALLLVYMLYQIYVCVKYGAVLPTTWKVPSSSFARVRLFFNVKHEPHAPFLWKAL